MTKLKLKVVGETKRTPARTALAEAIDNHAAALARRDRVKAAIERASDLLFGDTGAIRASEKAATALEKAKANESEHLLAQALGEVAEDTTSPVQRAERAFTAADARLDVARKTIGALERELQPAETALGYAKDDVDKCVAAVVRSEVDVAKLFAEAQAVQADLINKRVVLRHLFNNDFVAEPEAGELRSFLLNNYSFPACTGQVENENFDKHPATDRLRAAIAALSQNADAVLPAMS